MRPTVLTILIAAVAWGCRDEVPKGTPVTNPTPETLPSGVQMTELVTGVGEPPNASDSVLVHYRGTLTNGHEFDSSYKRRQADEFPLRAVIRCWTEGLQKMKPGGKAKLYCPADTAYGNRGSPPKIPPGAALLFEVELLSVKRY